MRKIDADLILERIEDAESLEAEMIKAAQKESGTVVTGAVVLAALKLFKNIVNSTPTAD